MKVPQLAVINTAAAVSKAAWRAVIFRSRLRFRPTMSTTTTTTSDHMIRWARISNAPAGLRSGQ